MKQFLDDCLPIVKEKIGRQVGLDICVCVNTSTLLVQTIGWWGWGWPQTTGYSHTQGFGEEHGRWEGVESRDMVQSRMPASFRPASFLIVLRLWSWLSSQTVVLSFGCALRPTAGKFFKNSDAPGWLNPDLWERETHTERERCPSGVVCGKFLGAWSSQIPFEKATLGFLLDTEFSVPLWRLLPFLHLLSPWNTFMSIGTLQGLPSLALQYPLTTTKKTRKSFIHTQCTSPQVIHVKCKVQYFLGISTALCIHPSPPSILEHFN